MYPFSFFIKKYGSLFILAALLLFCVGVWTAVYIETPPGKLTFAVLNIGQGDSLYIQSPTGIEVLVDSGPGGGALLRELPNVMRRGDRSIDAIIETHPDSDHMGGFVELIKRYKVGAFIEPGITKHNATIDALEEEVADGNIPKYIARRGMTLDLGGGARLDILFPDVDVSYFGERTNDGSIVARLVYGDTVALLTGDATIWTENRLLRMAGPDELASDILKVGHHGSKYSTGDAFVAAVHPSLAAISVGAKNTYGHPTEEVLNILARFNVPVLRTDQDGTLVFVSDGNAFARQQ